VRLISIESFSFIVSPEDLLEYLSCRLSLLRHNVDDDGLNVPADHRQVGVPKEADNDTEAEEAASRPARFCQDCRQKQESHVVQGVFGADRL